LFRYIKELTSGESEELGKMFYWHFVGSEEFVAHYYEETVSRFGYW